MSDSALNPTSQPVTKIRLGTRGSKLAMWQSTWVREQLQQRGVEVELIEIKTDGDVKTGPLAQIGGQGLFTKQLQIALLENQIDLAVHSLKDLPTEDHSELTIAAVPPREDTADALVSNSFASLDAMPSGTIIGTGSVRRAAQLRHLRSDLDIRDIRGNVDTRLAKLDGGDFDAIILACAGLRRLGLADRIRHAFMPIELMPAVGQGALGLETRSDDQATVAAVGPLSDPISYHRAMAERSLLKGLSAGCLAPVGASTAISEDGSALTLTGVILSTDGQRRLLSIDTLPMEESKQLGHAVAQKLIEQGGDKLLLEPR